MKQSLLITSLALMATGLSAQTRLVTEEDARFEKVSDDGRYMVALDQGSLKLFDNETNAYDFYPVGEDYLSPYYTVGFGNVFSSDGILVGNYDDSQPAYLKDGEWHLLPLAEGDNSYGKSNSADGITPDGSRICGGIAAAAYSIDANDVMLAPVYWEKEANGEYGMYHRLPYPTKDFTGRTPQYVTARCISDDGKTITGQIIDWSGFYALPIVYREQANGEWTYEVFGSELVYNTDAVFPDYPSYEPRSPKEENYMTEEEYAAYQVALTDYEDAVDDYYNGLIDDYPEYPSATDYMGEETLSAWNAAQAVYQAENMVYQDSVAIFNEVFEDLSVVYGTFFEFNNLAMSRDGKYFASTFHALDENGDPDAWFPELVSTPYRFNLTDGSYEICDDTNALVSSVLNDGTVLACNPADDVLRSTYVMAPGTTEVIDLIDYVADKNAVAAQLMTENLTFQTAELDWDTWESIPGEEGVYTGTAYANGEGNVIYGWLTNNFYGVEWYCFSYCLTIDSATGIAQIKTDAPQGQITDITITDAAGAQVAKAQGSLRDVLQHLGQGIYFITFTTADGAQKTQKIVRH